MNPNRLLTDAIVPACGLVGLPMDDRDGLVLTLTIAGQESDWRHRFQIGGPARSYWQFELTGGVAGLFGHARAEPLLRLVCEALDVPASPSATFDAMPWNDVLAAAMARLLLWTDPAPLPAADDVRGGWAYYQRNWRPGAPRPDAWPAYHARALGIVSSGTVATRVP